MALLMLPAMAQASIQAGQVTVPSAVGLNVEATVAVDWDRVPGGGADTIRIEVVTPDKLNFVLASNPSCVASGVYLDCNVSGANGVLTFKVTGATLGGFNIRAWGVGNATNEATPASQSGDVYNSGDLTVGKTMPVPASGVPLSGEPMRFDLTPRIDPVGGMGLPNSSSSIVVEDVLPGTVALGFVVDSWNITGSVPPAQRTCVQTTVGADRLLRCTFIGPLSVAQVNSTTIEVNGHSMSSGGFINNVSIGAAGQYVDANSNNNTAAVNYNVNAASDLTIRASSDQPLGTSGTPMGGNASRTFNLTPINIGPLDAPAGAVVKTVVPADWIVTSAPGCSITAGGSLTLDAGNSGTGYNNGQHSNGQSGTFNGQLIECSLPLHAPGSWTNIPITVTLPNPAAPVDGYLPMVIEPPGALPDFAPTNNGTAVRWWLVPEAADLQMWKTKTPALVQVGGVRTSTMTVYNAGPAVATYTAANPVRVIDWLNPLEIDPAIGTNGVVNGSVTAGWSCTATAGSPRPGGDAALSTRVECSTTGSGTIPVTTGNNNGMSVSFQHQVTSNPAALGGVSTTLTNTACTGSAALNAWTGAPPAATGPTPADPDGSDNGSTSGNSIANRGDCHSVNGTVTSVETGEAEVTFKKEVVVLDRLGAVVGSFQRAPVADGTAPLLAGDADKVQWKMTITTASVGDNANQKVIPTLELRDTFQRLANLTDAGGPNYRKADPIVARVGSVSITGGGVGGSTGCPATLNRSGSSSDSSQLLCTFTNVSPGTTIEVTYEVTRPFMQDASGYIGNTAELQSPDAMLSAAAGNLATVNSRVFSDTAHARVTPRADVAMTNKSISTDPSNGPSTNPGRQLARVGEIVTFTISARNNGIDTISNGGFRISDSFPVNDTASAPGYEVISATPANPAVMGCTVTPAGANTDVVCLNTAPIPRWQTQSIAVKARIVRPTAAAYPPAGTYMYEDVRNTATVSLLNGMCEFRSEGSNGVGGGTNDSTTCDDGALDADGAGSAALGNNQKTVAFDVALPSFDLQQSKVRLQGNSGQPPVLAGQSMKYRFGVYNSGPSRSQQVEIVDVLALPHGFDMTFQGISDVNTAAPGAGGNPYPASTLATRFNGTVSCAFDGPATPSTTQPGIDFRLMKCVLHGTPADNYLDGGESANFVLEFTPTPPMGQTWGDFSDALTFSNTAYVCGDETDSYESSGECVHKLLGFPDLSQAVLDTAANNKASVSNTVLPVTDLEVVSKTAQINPADVGQSVPWTIVLRNNGVSATTAMRVVDTLPSGFEWVPGDGSLAAPFPQVGTPTNGTTLSAAGGNLAVAGAVPATDAANVCYVSNGVTSVTTATPVQEITCHIDGNFPATGGYTLTLHARPKSGVYAGPWLVNVNNHVEVQPGQDSAGYPLSGDNDPTNNDEDGPVQVRNASIGGRVFVDANNNGDQEGGDAGLPNVEVRLTGTDLYGNVINLVTYTDASGDYVFSGLAPSDGNGYTVQQVQNAATTGAYNNGVPQPNDATRLNRGIDSTGVTDKGTASVNATGGLISGIVLGSGGEGVQFDFPEVTLHTLSGYVYVDRNTNNAYNPGPDDPIPGAQLELLELVGGTYVPVAGPAGVATTDGNGYYLFTGLDPAKTYAVREALPAGWVNRPSAVTPGTCGGGACAAGTAGTGVAGDGATTDRISGIQLTGNGQNYNFGEQEGAEVSGKVFLDYNNDGVQNGSDSGIGGQTIQLRDAAGTTVIATTTTAADGTFSFTLLPPGTYTLYQPNQPAGTANGITTEGTVNGTPMGVPTDVSTLPSQIGSIVLAPGQKSVNNQFAEIPANSTISGRVWLDLDNDGVVDPGEDGIEGVTVRLTGTDSAGNPVSIDTVTDAQGRYAFNGLSPGTYTVTEPTQPPNTFNGETVPGSAGGTGTPVSDPVSAIGSIVLGANQHSVDNNFGEIRGASIAGRVYNDNNDDGVVDPGETGIPGVEVVLTGVDDLGNPVSRTTTTDANGNYRFDGLRPGTYKVTEPTQPPQTLNGETTPGSTGGSATPKSTAPSAIDGIVLKPGEASVDNNFGEISDSPDMLVSKSVAPATLVTGTAATYTIVVRNGGQRPSDGEYAVQDRLPDGFVLTGTPTGQGWVCTGAAGDVRFGCTSSTVLAAGETSAATISVPVKVGNAAGTVRNAVLVEGGGEYDFRKPTPAERDAFENDVPNLSVCDPAITRNACQLPSEVVLAWPNVVVSKSADSPVFTVGTPASYLIRVRNIGERATDAGYKVEDRLPTGIVLAGAPSGDGWTCTGARGDSGFQCTSDRVLAADETHPGTIKVPVEVRPEAVDHGTVNNAVLVAGGGEPSDRGPTPDERSNFEQHPDTLDECDPAISQNACRVPNEVQMPKEPTVLRIAKRGDRQVVEIGDSLVYTIDIRHVSGAGLYQVDVIDRLPRGFTYIDGSARVDGMAIPDPQGRPGPMLVFEVGALPTQGQKVLTYRVRVGVGAAQGDGINRAHAHGCQADACVDPDSGAPLPGSSPSNPTEYKVTVTGGVFTDEGCVLGKIFVDCNLNHVQDREELGIPGVRLYFEDGTWMVSDSEGKYSYCGLPPRSHTLKVDPSTLPTGSRLTTSSNRNLGDADSLFIDLKNGELHRADFVEGSCSNPVIEQVKARRTQGEVRAPETETGKPPLRFESKPLRVPQQGTDSSNQRPIVDPRPLDGRGAADSREDGSKEVQP